MIILFLWPSNLSTGIPMREAYEDMRAASSNSIFSKWMAQCHFDFWSFPQDLSCVFWPLSIYVSSNIPFFTSLGYKNLCLFHFVLNVWNIKQCLPMTGFPHCRIFLTKHLVCWVGSGGRLMSFLTSFPENKQTNESFFKPQAETLYTLSNDHKHLNSVAKFAW